MNQDVVTTTDKKEVATALAAAVENTNLGSDMLVEDIQSFYWWKGDVQDEGEIRLSFKSTVDFAQVEKVIAGAHNYETPMIIQHVTGESPYWRGDIDACTAQVASDLAAKRLVACAQLTKAGERSGLLSVKTVTAAKPHIEKFLETQGMRVRWTPITGNKPYLDWVGEETKIP